MIKRIFLLLSLLALVVIITSVMMTRARAPGWVRQKILTALTESCPKCKAELDSVEVDFLAGQVVLHDFEFVDTPEHSSQVAVKAHLIEVQFDPKRYLKGLIVVDRVKGDDVNFTLIEDSRIQSSPDDPSPPLSGLPPMVIREVEVSNSAFRYLHKTNHAPASLQLTKIHGRLGSWVTRPDLSADYAPTRTPMAAWGVLENSGDFSVKSEIDALSQKGTVKIDVTVKETELASVSGFFVNETGVGIEGLLLEAHTDLDMRDGKINGTLRATYTGLKIKVENRKNSGVKNFLETVGAKIVINGEQGVNGKPPGEKAFRYERAADQSLFSAIFKALGVAAKDLVK